MDYKPFKMKGFPMQKGTGSYLKEASIAKMKKEAMKMKKESEAMKMKEAMKMIDAAMKMKDEGSIAKLKEAMKMKKEDTMAKQRASGGGGSKPDFLDLDGDGNKKESMKKAAADKKGSPAPQTAREAKKATKKARKFVRKANRITDRANKYIKRKGKDASMVVDETGETVERYELTPKQAKKVDKKKAKAAKAFSKAKGVEAEFMSKYKSPAPQKENTAYNKYKKSVKDANDEFKSFIGQLHSEGRADTTGFSKTGRFKYDKVDEKAVKDAQKTAKKKVKDAEKQAKKEGVKFAK